MSTSVMVDDDVLIVDPNPGAPQGGSMFGMVVGRSVGVVPDVIVVESVRGYEWYHENAFYFEASEGKPWLMRDRWVVSVPYRHEAT